jgi:hypothetical protein
MEVNEIAKKKFKYNFTPLIDGEEVRFITKKELLKTLKQFCNKLCRVKYFKENPCEECAIFKYRWSQMEVGDRDTGYDKKCNFSIMKEIKEEIK